MVDYLTCSLLVRMADRQPKTTCFLLFSPTQGLYRSVVSYTYAVMCARHIDAISKNSVLDYTPPQDHLPEEAGHDLC